MNEDKARRLDPDFARTLRAVSHAARAHEGQLRKDGMTPYAAHPTRVALILMRVFGVTDPEVLTTALLHDTIEDTTVDRDEIESAFGRRVGEYVSRLTKDKRLPESARETAYLEALAAASTEVQICKLADCFDNLLDSDSISATARARLMRRTREVVAVLKPRLPPAWQHVAAAVEDELARLPDSAPNACKE